MHAFFTIEPRTQFAQLKALPACIIFFCSLFISILSYSQNRILHYTETSGYDHQTRSVSLFMFQQIATQLGCVIDDDSTGQNFNSPASLQNYDLIIFSNTSGDGILDSLQKQNFEQYIADGGSFIGIHAASDTYRHSSANGANTGAWDWYAEMLGASVQQNPNHVSGTPVYGVYHTFIHPVITGIPDPWQKTEEYYYWENGYFDSSNIVIQKVEQTIGPNMQVNSYDSSRAVTWIKYHPGGARVFYTSLGHAVSNYSSDTLFYKLMSNAVIWCTEQTSGLEYFYQDRGLNIFPNPANDIVHISSNNQLGSGRLLVRNSHGTTLVSRDVDTLDLGISITDLDDGLYFIQYLNSSNIYLGKFIKIGF
ncbi:MAG TPA: ThuA domain-containing protein [Bacteroidia bacterium]|nr:ThuA domain-containing protein [Bacteroidia bacterium]